MGDLKRFLSRETVFLLTILGVFEVSGNLFGFYNAFAAYDIVTHFLGGALVSSIAITFLLGYLKHFSYPINVVFTLGVGGIWEIVEFLVDLVFKTGMQNGLNDTMVDMIMVLFAAITVNLIHYYTRKKRKGFLEN